MAESTAFPDYFSNFSDSYAAARPTYPRELFAYIATWSALNRHVERHGRTILDDTRASVAPVWGDPGRKRAVTMDFYVRGWGNDC